MIFTAYYALYALSDSSFLDDLLSLRDTLTTTTSALLSAIALVAIVNLYKIQMAEKDNK